MHSEAVRAATELRRLGQSQKIVAPRIEAHLRSTFRSIERCGRRGRYAVAGLITDPGHAKLTDLLMALANCPKATAVSIRDAQQLAQ